MRNDPKCVYYLLNKAKQKTHCRFNLYVLLDRYYEIFNI